MAKRKKNETASDAESETGYQAGEVAAAVEREEVMQAADDAYEAAVVHAADAEAAKRTFWEKFKASVKGFFTGDGL